jgi:hypothetical protein
VQTSAPAPSATEPGRIGALYVQRNPDKLQGVLTALAAAPPAEKSRQVRQTRTNEVSIGGDVTRRDAGSSRGCDHRQCFNPTSSSSAGKRTITSHTSARYRAEVCEQFSEKELSTLTFRVMGIHAWNRANVAFRTTPGAYDKAFGLDKAGLV